MEKTERFCTVGAATVENSTKKLKIELLYDPTIPLLGIYQKKSKTLIWKDICTHMFIAAIYSSQDKEATQVLSNRQVDKGVVPIYNGILLAIKKNKILPFVSAWMDLEGIMLSEISQRKTNTIWFHVYMESKE